MFFVINQELRERWVEVARAKILQEQLNECYMRETVNHMENCRHLAKKYFEVINSPTFGIRKHNVFKGGNM